MYIASKKKGNSNSDSNSDNNSNGPRKAIEAVMDCYLRSKLDVRENRKKMLSLWRRKGRFEISEQRLADQIKLVKQNQWLTTVNIEEMKRKIMETDHFERNISLEQDPNTTGSDDL